MDPDTGQILHRWGKGMFYMPHMITIDNEGAVWVADAGRQQVLKLTPGGKLLASTGAEGQPGHDRGHFCKPTQVRDILSIVWFL